MLNQHNMRVHTINIKINSIILCFIIIALLFFMINKSINNLEIRINKEQFSVQPCYDNTSANLTFSNNVQLIASADVQNTDSVTAYMLIIDQDNFIVNISLDNKKINPKIAENHALYLQSQCRSNISQQIISLPKNNVYTQAQQQTNIITFSKKIDKAHQEHIFTQGTFESDEWQEKITQIGRFECIQMPDIYYRQLDYMYYFEYDRTEDHSPNNGTQFSLSKKLIEALLASLVYSLICRAAYSVLRAKNGQKISGDCCPDNSQLFILNHNNVKDNGNFQLNIQYLRKIQTQRCFRSQRKERKNIKGLLFCLLVMLCAVKATNNYIDPTQWRFVDSTSYCETPYQASFHPKDLDLVLIACFGPQAFLLYSTAQNNLNIVSQLKTSSNPGGIQFSPIDGARAVGVYIQSKVSLLSVSRQAISTIYDLNVSVSYLQSIAITPSGQYAAVVNQKCVVLYISVSAQTLRFLQTYTASPAQQCRGITYLNDDIVLIGAQNGIYQYKIAPTKINFFTQLLQSSSIFVSQISFMSGSNTTGAFASYLQNYFDSFNYQYNGNKSSLKPTKLLVFSNPISISFNSNNNKVILGGYYNITLYTYQCLYYNCQTCAQDGYCITCRNGYYSADDSRNCSMKCIDGCLNCLNSTSCLTCKGSQGQANSRLLPDCKCPEGYFQNEMNPEDCITQENEDKSSGLSDWMIVLIVFFSLLIGGVLAFFGYRYYLKKKHNNNLNSEFNGVTLTSNLDYDQMNTYEERYNKNNRGQINASNDSANRSTQKE